MTSPALQAMEPSPTPNTPPRRDFSLPQARALNVLQPPLITLTPLRTQPFDTTLPQTQTMHQTLNSLQTTPAHPIHRPTSTQLAEQARLSSHVPSSSFPMVTQQPVAAPLQRPQVQIPHNAALQFHRAPVQTPQQTLYMSPGQLPVLQQTNVLTFSQQAPIRSHHTMPQVSANTHAPQHTPAIQNLLAFQQSNRLACTQPPNTCYNPPQPAKTICVTTNTSRARGSPTNGYANHPQVQHAADVPKQQNTLYKQLSPVMVPQHTPTKPTTATVSLNGYSPQRHDQTPAKVVTTPQSTIPRDAAAVQYWKRLQALLTSARSFALELQPNRSGLSRPSETPRQIAYDLQGLTASAADAHAAKQNEHYKSAYEARAAGDFIEYGVASGHAVWAAHVLSAVVGSPSPAASILDAPFAGTCQDNAVEDVRVRVFEAEVSCLPVEFVEALLKRRRSMRRFKNRIDLCVRILLAFEGRGRRPTQASLDRMKLQLEKADIQARVEAEREAARKERERQKHERVRKVGVKAEDGKKRKRQQSAQANFMMRFVKRDDKDAVEEEDVVVVETTREGFVAPLAKDRDVMSVAWWLRAEMPATSLDKLDQILSARREQNLTLSELGEHLVECTKRRELAERRIHVVLREYRRQRKMHTENRTPMFAPRRADVRGRGVTGPVKLLQFAENYRPAFFGTFGRRSRSVSGRRPLGKDTELDYECDSADEWDEDEEGEDLLDVEADKELASEEAELRRLYGSDDEDDDDFLDDADVEDDDDGNGDEDENSAASCPASQEMTSPLKRNESSSAVIDLTLTAVNESKGEQIQKRPSKDDMRRRGGKRRKGMLKQSVVIYNVSIPNGESSPLDRFAVNAFEGSQPIQMFNPFVYTSSDIVAEHLKAKPPSLRSARASNMDESTKLDLAAALMRTGSTKDKIVLQFCEHRKLRGLAVPTKAEIMRAIGEIATKEKRDGDSRAFWHLTDQSIARKVAQMNNPAPTALPHASASVVVD